MDPKSPSLTLVSVSGGVRYLWLCPCRSVGGIPQTVSEFPTPTPRPSLSVDSGRTQDVLRGTPPSGLRQSSHEPRTLPNLGSLPLPIFFPCSTGLAESSVVVSGEGLRFGGSKNFGGLFRVSVAPQVSGLSSPLFTYLHLKDAKSPHRFSSLRTVRGGWRWTGETPGQRRRRKTLQGSVSRGPDRRFRRGADRGGGPPPPPLPHPPPPARPPVRPLPWDASYCQTSKGFTFAARTYPPAVRRRPGSTGTSRRPCQSGRDPTPLGAPGVGASDLPRAVLSVSGPAGPGAPPSPRARVSGAPSL